MARRPVNRSVTLGKIVQVIGPVIDVEFEPEQLPDSTTR